ncbi:MAG TPA: hypothetical protein VGJ13_16045 [Pseudonocardiaceae bacterium]
MRDPQNLGDEDEQRLKAMLARCPRLEAVRRHGGAFAHMIRDLRGDLLPAWMDAVLADDCRPALLRQRPAPRPGRRHRPAHSALEQRSTEGAVNKIKFLKRQCFGRADFSLMRMRILLAT